MDRSPVIALFAILLLMGLLLPTASVSAGSLPHESGRTASVDNGGQNEVQYAKPVLQTAASTAAINNTTQHENPEEAAAQNDVGDITRWLEGRLGERLSQSTVELSQGQADLATRLLGDEFTNQFERYAYVTGTTGTDSDDQTAERFHRTQETQQEFTTTVQDYRETQAEYEQARQNGNEDQARRLARELQRLSQRTNRTGGSLRTDYATLSNQTAANLTEASGTVQNLTQNITEQQAEIIQETFVQTTFSLQPRSREISFLDPLQLQGRLVAEDGSTLGERTVRIRIGEQTFRTQTDSNGEFDLTYRPTLLGVGQQAVAARFLPRNESVYLGSNGSVAVSISQVTPRLSIERTPQTVAFNDQVEVSGRVSAENISAGGVPVDILLGGVTLGTTRTAPDGTYSFSTRLPANIDDGNETLTARVPLEDRALAGVEEARPVTVDPTSTTVTISGKQVNGDEIRVSGNLETDLSRGIPNQPVTLRIDGQSLATTETGTDGSFNERVFLPPDVIPEDGNASVTLAARFDRSNSNLQPSRTRTTLGLQALESGVGGAGADSRSAGSSIFSIPDEIPSELIATIAIGGLLILIGGTVYLRRGRNAGEVESSAESDTGDSATDLRSKEPTAPSTEELSPMLADAKAALADDETDTAVRLAYMALKRSMTESLDLPEGTHWEFFVACQETAQLEDDRIETLRRLTEMYEQAAFAPRPVSADDANWVFETVRSLDRHSPQTTV